MREFNFEVIAAPTGKGDVILRAALGRSYSAKDMVEDFPRNMLHGFIETVILQAGAPSPLSWVVGSGNAVELRSSVPLELAPWQVAAAACLCSYGLDFEAETSQTLKSLTVFSDAAAGLEIAALLEALTWRNTEAAGAMSQMMAEHPTDEEFAAETWPGDMPDRYLYDLQFDFPVAPAEDVVARLTGFLKALDQLVAWTGLNPDMGPQEALGKGLTPYEVLKEVKPTHLRYYLSAPACNPAIPMQLLMGFVTGPMGIAPQNLDIYVSGAN